MMERSSKFLSLSGLAGIFAGVYALTGVSIAHFLLKFRPMGIDYGQNGLAPSAWTQLLIVAGAVLLLAVGTAVWFSYRQSVKRAEPFWNPVSRRLVYHMGVPLATGGFLLIFLMIQGAAGLLAPLTMVFYGLALFNAGQDSYREVKSLGLILTALGLLSVLLIQFQLLFWAAGFGLMHIIYGIYIHLTYER